MSELVCSFCGHEFFIQNALNRHRSTCTSYINVDNNITNDLTDQRDVDLTFDEGAIFNIDEMGNAEEDPNHDRNEHDSNDEQVDILKTYLMFQEQLLKYEYILKGRFKKDPAFMNNATMALFGNKYSLSDTAMDVCRKISEVFAIRNKSIWPAVKNRFGNIRGSLLKKWFRLFNTETFKYKVLKEFSDKKKPDTIFIGHFVNPLKVAAYMLINMKVGDIHLSPPVCLDSNGVRYIHEPASGDFYKQLFEYTQERYGANTYPLPISMSTDDLALNKANTRGAKPAYISIASKKGKVYWKDNIKCVGFSPVNKVSILTPLPGSLLKTSLRVSLRGFT
jgi:hypothetical protein